MCQQLNLWARIAAIAPLSDLFVFLNQTTRPTLLLHTRKPLFSTRPLKAELLYTSSDIAWKAVGGWIFLPVRKLGSLTIHQTIAKELSHVTKHASDDDSDAKSGLKAGELLPPSRCVLNYLRSRITAAITSWGGTFAFLKVWHDVLATNLDTAKRLLQLLAHANQQEPSGKIVILTFAAS